MGSSNSADLTALLEEVAEGARPFADQGRPTDAARPEDADASRFALAMSGVDGAEHAVGDADVPVAIQSVSKLFTLTLALQKVGEDLWERMSREPSGDPYNSLVQLERERGIPRNPMINSGALVVCDVLLDHCDDPHGELLELLADLADGEVDVSTEVVASEEERGDRNRGSAHLMASFGNLHHSVDDVMGVYTRQCAITMTARQLARAVRFLAHDGVEPRTGRAVVTPQLARRINAIMLTCGTYDFAGQFAYEVGIPCKSGITGLIVADVPHHFGVCTWSPPLDASGNSRAGRVALDRLTAALDCSIF